MDILGTKSNHPRTVIHLGLPKTATTLLQDCLFDKHSELTHIPMRQMANQQESPRLKGTNIECQGSRFIQDLPKMIEPYLLKGKTCVVSHERLSIVGSKDKRYQAEMFRNLFGDCKILLTVREPLSLIESYYFQNLKTFNKKKRHSLKQKFGKPPRYFNINEWFSAHQDMKSKNKIQSLLHVADTAEIYADVFGKENITLVIFEKIKRTPHEFLADICRCLGISLAEAISLCEGQTRNVSFWTEASIERLKRVENSFFSKWYFRFNLKKQKYRTSDRELMQRLRFESEAKNQTSPKAQAHMDPKWKAMVEEIGREQSQRLVDEWGLPLAKYGYPVTDNREKIKVAA